MAEVLESDSTSAEEITWASISLTHVEYPKGDKIGHLLAWCSLIPIFLCIAFFTLILFRRDLHTISYFTGLLISEAVNWILKHIIKELRPMRNREVFCEYGMPSSHAQFMAFFSTYFLLFVCFRLHRSNKLIDNLWKYIALAVILITSACVMYSRIYLLYHTVFQVCYGILVGILLAVGWFTVVQYLLSPLFPVIASWSLFQFLMIRDLSLIPNVMWFEYCTQRDEVRNRLRKSAGVKKSQ